MLELVNKWLDLPSNIFTSNGCSLTISKSPGEAVVKSITVDFEIEKYMCRLIFWNSGYGHIEVIDSETEEAVKDQEFQPQKELDKDIPFVELWNFICS